MSRAVLAALLLAAACARDGGPLREGMTAVVHYELDSEGVPVESTRERGEPLEFVAGSRALPAAVEAALLGRRPGHEAVVALGPGEAFGFADPAKRETVPLSAFGAMAAGLRVGDRVGGVREGRAEEARVLARTADSVTLDFNHPLAGKALRYRVTLVATRAGR